jgi:hypothetical protein
MNNDKFKVDPLLHDALIDLYTITLRNIMYANDFAAYQQFNAEEQRKNQD